MLTTLLLAAVISIVAGSYLTYLGSQLKEQSRVSSVEAATQLGSAIQMMFSETGSCQQNLSAAGFGTSLLELKSKSSDGRIRILYPTSGPQHGEVLAAGKIYERVIVKSLGFSKIVQVNAPDTTYRADLVIETTDMSGLSIRPTVIPFYFMTTASGTFTSCFASNYPFISDTDPKAQAATMEDVLCSQKMGSGYVYAPSGQTCIPGTTVIGSL